MPSYTDAEYIEILMKTTDHGLEYDVPIDCDQHWSWASHRTNCRMENRSFICVVTFSALISETDNPVEEKAPGGFRDWAGRVPKVDG